MQTFILIYGNLNTSPVLSNDVYCSSLLITYRNSLEGPISLVEQESALKESTKLKSPGPDGLPFKVYTKFGQIFFTKIGKNLDFLFVSTINVF